MGKSLKTLLMIGIAVFNPAAALGLTGFAATAFNFIAQTALGAILGGDERRGGGGGVADSGFLVNQQGNTKSVDIVYGTRRIAGTRVYINTSDMVETAPGSGVYTATVGDGKDEYLHMAIAIAQGGVETNGDDAIKGFSNIYFNDRLAWNAGSGVDAYYNGLLSIRLYNGSAGQDINNPTIHAGETQWALASDFNTGHDGKGIAWAYITLKYSRDKFPGMPTMIFEIEGKRVRRVDTQAWSDDINEMRNPANVIYDYLRSERYGKGLDASYLDLASFQNARNYCNTAGLTCDGAVQTSGTIFNNVNSLLSSANCNLVFSNGQYKLIPVKQENFSGAFEFNTSNIVGEWQLALGSKKTRFNTFEVKFFNPALDWQPDSILIENATYLAEDGGAVSQKAVDLPFTSDATLANKLATYYLDQSRYQTVVNFKATHAAMQLEVGQPVYVDHATPGWTGVNKKKFRVSSLTLMADGNVDVVLTEYAPDNIYLENN